MKPADRQDESRPDLLAAAGASDFQMRRARFRLKCVELFRSILAANSNRSRSSVAGDVVLRMRDERCQVSSSSVCIWDDLYRVHGFAGLILRGLSRKDRPLEERSSVELLDLIAKATAILQGRQETAVLREKMGAEADTVGPDNLTPHADFGGAR